MAGHAPAYRRSNALRCPKGRGLKTDGALENLGLTSAEGAKDAAKHAAPISQAKGQRKRTGKPLCLFVGQGASLAVPERNRISRMRGFAAFFDGFFAPFSLHRVVAAEGVFSLA